MEIPAKKVGAQLCSQRERVGWSQLQLAQRLAEMRGAGVTQSQVSIWENGGSMSKATLALLRRVIAELSQLPSKQSAVHAS